MKLKYSFIIVALCLMHVAKVHSQSDSLNAKGLKKYWESLIHGNVDKSFERRLDMSYVIAPCYTREGGFGIGGAATALYRLDRTDSIMQPSDLSLSGSASVNGFYGITAKGNNHFRGNKSRLSYRLQFLHKTLDFWGISYEACAVNPISEYTRQQIKWESDYVYKLTKDIHIGAALKINYSDLTHIANPAYLEGQRKSYFFAGAGASVQYDTRDFILNPKKGIYFMARGIFYPDFASTYDKSLFNTTLMFDAYQRVWRGGILAMDLYGQFYSEQVPWALREELGSGSSRMRGYYAGRYMDTNQITAQLELRQHIYSRLGCVAWIGGGTVFPSFKELKLQHTLPNYGLGLRVEFKHNVNIRIDYGFGKDTAGFVFQFAEAF